MIDKTAATAIATEYLAGCVKRGAPEASLTEPAIEREFGWVFFYESTEYLRNGVDGKELIGNAPLIVDRRDGTLHLTGTARPIEHYIAEYERKRAPGA